ncbi:MAG: 3-phosphoshikimate 1-carboxyvinyltransferase [Oscillospiraceae bacterium]|nr:3-phosphoshikimate 1-carboxyvinyltransferase [Oscillospiraceae bacterium]
MNIKKIRSLNGVIEVPGDKSISHRAVMLGALADGDTEIYGFLKGADCLATIDCFRKMGIKIDESEDRIIVHGKGLHGLRAPSETLYTANSGTTTRLLCGILAGQGFDTQITGDASVQKRPMKRVIEPLSKMGAHIEGDFCPLRITGSKLKSITYDMTVASAQVKTAILLAGLYADGTTTVNEIEKSRDHTELMLSSMGADIKTNGLSVSVSKCEKLTPHNITVCGDISSAAFFMVAAAVMPDSRVTIKNAGINPTRSGIIDVMREMGADITVTGEHTVSGEPVGDITVSSSKMHGTKISGPIIPRLIDEIPAIAVLAAFAEGETVISDARELKVKETNRIRAIVDEFTKCGVDITETEDGMIIRRTKNIKGADFKTYGDHRMAMSLAILAQNAEGESSLDDSRCVDVSFPGFFDLFYSLEN